MKNAFLKRRCAAYTGTSVHTPTKEPYSMDEYPEEGSGCRTEPVVGSRAIVAKAAETFASNDVAARGDAACSPLALMETINVCGSGV